MKRRYTIIVAILIGLLAHAQPSKTYRDSVAAVVKGQLADTLKVLLLIDASKKYLLYDTDVSLKYAFSARDLAVKAEYRKGIALAYKYTGISYYFKSQYIEALSEWQQSYNFFDSIQDKQGEANILSNMGAAYFNLGENDKALKRYLDALRIAEDLNDTLRKATSLINIGAVYFDKPSTHNLALENYLEALELSILLDDKRAIGTVCVNMGEIYLARGEDALAMEYYIKAYNAVMGSDAEAAALIGIGDVHAYRNEYEKALDYHERALNIANSNDATMDAVSALMALAKTNYSISNYKESVSRFKSAMPLAKEIEANKQLQIIYEGLANNFSQLNQYDSAYHYQELFGFIKDTIFNLEADKKLNMLRLDYEIEKKESEIKQLTEINKLNEESISRRKIITNLVIAGLISVLVFLYIALKQKRRIEKEKHRSDELLLNILPYEVAEELKEKGESDAKNYTEVSVLFTDFISFTDLAQELSAKDLVKEINFYFKAFDDIITKYKIEKIKTIGDAYMAACGLPKADAEAPKKVVLASLEMQDLVIKRQLESNDPNAKLFNMRVGIHTGPVVAGIVGVKKFQYDIWGDTVNTASRMESYGEVAKVNISEDTYAKLKKDPEFTFEARGIKEVKGKGKMQMYFVSLKK